VFLPKSEIKGLGKKGPLKRKEGRARLLSNLVFDIGLKFISKNLFSTSCRTNQKFGNMSSEFPWNSFLSFSEERNIRIYIDIEIINIC
jgi:hypothetical protein